MVWSYLFRETSTELRVLRGRQFLDIFDARFWAMEGNVRSLYRNVVSYISNPRFSLVSMFHNALGETLPLNSVVFEFYWIAFGQTLAANADFIDLILASKMWNKSFDMDKLTVIIYDLYSYEELYYFHFIWNEQQLSVLKLLLRNPVLREMLNFTTADSTLSPHNLHKRCIKMFVTTNYN